MAIYKAVKTSRGTRYLKVELTSHGTREHPKFVGKTKIPASVLDALESMDEVDESALALQPLKRECIFCGETCKNTRRVNNQTVYLCNEHYYAKTIGKVAERIREINSEQPVA